MIDLLFGGSPCQGFSFAGKMPMGKEIYKNLKPSDSQNKIFWLKV